MIFTQFAFFVFFAVTFATFWALKGERARRVWLLVASYFFYGYWDYRFLGLIFACTVLDYVVGLTLGALALGLYAWLVLPRLWSWSSVAGPVIAIAMVGCLAAFALSRVPSSVHLWRAIEVYRRLAGSN